MVTRPLKERVRYSNAILASMELIPKALVVGLFTLPQGPQGPLLTIDKVNRIWSDLAPMYGYTQLQSAPDGSQASFIGASPDDGVTIQPPLIQVRDSVRLTAEKSAEEVETILKTIGRHLGATQFFNLGIKHVFHAPIPDNDARGYVLHRILGKSDADLVELEMGDQSGMWAGVKYVLSYDEATYTLVLEPLIADKRNVFVDLDVQFPGEVNLDAVADRAKDARSYVMGPVSRYLDKSLS